MQLLEMVFKHLKEANLKMKLGKYQFFKKYLHYLGNLISKQGIQPLLEKSTKKKLKELSNIDELHHFLDLAGYYRKFVPLFTDVTKPLNINSSRRTPSFSGHHNAKQLLNTLSKHSVRNPYSSILVQKTCTCYLLMPVIKNIQDSSSTQFKVLRIWGL